MKTNWDYSQELLTAQEREIALDDMRERLTGALRRQGS